MCQMKQSANARVAEAERELMEYFLRGGYVRHASPELTAAFGARRYKKGEEVRIVLRSRAEQRRVHALLAAAGMLPGSAFEKNGRFVQPVYGRSAVRWFLDRLPRGRDRARLGFTADGRRIRRRAADA
jgi:hypothetical protein